MTDTFKGVFNFGIRQRLSLKLPSGYFRNVIFDNVVIFVFPQLYSGIVTWQQLKNQPQIPRNLLLKGGCLCLFFSDLEGSCGCSSQQNMAEVMLNGSGRPSTQSLPGVLGIILVER